MAVNNSLNNTANSFSTTTSLTVGNALTVTTGGITSTGTISLTGGNVDLATDASAHTVTIGNTTGASSLLLKTGTADMSLASATGTIMSALDTGEITYPLQSAFCGFVSAAGVANVTGDGTTYTVIFDSEVFDQNSDFNTGTGTFTAPVTGRYLLGTIITTSGIISTVTTSSVNIVTSNRTLRVYAVNPYATMEVGTTLSIGGAELTDMDSADTATVTVQYSNGTKVIDILGDNTNLLTAFSGYLAV